MQDGNGAMRQRRGSEDGARSPTSSPKQLLQPWLKGIRGLKTSGPRWAHSADPVANRADGVSPVDVEAAAPSWAWSDGWIGCSSGVGPRGFLIAVVNTYADDRGGYLAAWIAYYAFLS